MPRYPLVQIVDAPTTTATVLYNFQDDVTGQNLVTIPRFTSAGPAAGGTWLPDGGTPNFNNADFTGPASGGRVGFIQSAGVGDMKFVYDTTIKEARSYTYSCYVRPGVTGNYQAYIDGLATGSLVSCPAGQWTRVSVAAALVPVGPRQMAVYKVGGSTAGQFAYFADAMLSPTPALVAYGDGGMTNWAWSGAPFASVSVQSVTGQPALYRTELASQDWQLPELSLLGDPDAVGVEWALGQVRFTQTILGTKPNAMARQAAMSKAMLQQRFWLMFQLNATSTPVWWHAYRTPPGNLSLEQVYVTGSLTDRWDISGTIDVDPFSWSARTTLATKTIGNNPANDTTVPSAGYNLPAIKGDAPTGLRVSIRPQGTAARSQHDWLVCCISSDRPAPITRRPIGTGDVFTAGASTAAGASDSVAIGGSSRSVTMAANAPIAWRLVGSSQSVPPGQQAVYVRATAKQTSAGTGVIGAVVSFQLALGTTTQPTRSFVGQTKIGSWDQALSANPDEWKWIFLGVIGVGEGVPSDVAGNSSRTVTIMTGNPTATGVTLRMDDLLFVPVSGKGVASTTTLMTTTVGDLGQVATSTTSLVIDSDDNTSWLNGIDPSSVNIYNVGGFPIADPGAAYNTLLVLPLVDRAFNGDPTVVRTTDMATTTQVDVSYLPRAAWLGDGAT